MATMRAVTGVAPREIQIQESRVLTLRALAVALLEGLYPNVRLD
jgi:hypothetical protein